MKEPGRSDIRDSLQEIFRSVFDNEALQLADTTTADDVPGWDSLQQIKIILACEKKFGIRLRARDINGLGNVGEMVSHIHSAIVKTGSKPSSGP